MEQHAKERLTGGIILVALLVLLVPELLSGPSIPAPQAQAAPDQAPMRSYTLDLNDGSQHGSAPVAASTQPLESAPAAAPASVANAPPDPEPVAAAPVVSTPVDPASLAAQAASQPPPQEVPVPALPKPKTRSEPKSEPKSPVVATHPHASGGWSVQLGVFSSRANAQRLAAGLEQQGFAVKVAEIGGNSRKLYRVRVGSAHDRAGAQQLLARLRAAGQHDGVIVPP